jgi:hypothetical protein
MASQYSPHFLVSLHCPQLLPQSHGRFGFASLMFSPSLTKRSRRARDKSVHSFGLRGGVVLGWWLRDSSTMQQPTSSSSEYQIQQGKLSEMTSTANISAIKAVSGQPIAVPNKVENNAQPRQTKP